MVYRGARVVSVFLGFYIFREGDSFFVVGRVLSFFLIFSRVFGA